MFRWQLIYDFFFVWITGELENLAALKKAKEAGGITPAVSVKENSANNEGKMGAIQKWDFKIEISKLRFQNW